MPTNDLLRDEAEIRTLVARFGDAATRNDPAAFRALWTPDAEWRIGEPFPLQIIGVEKIETAFNTLMGQWEFFAHLPASVLVDVAGDTARARCTVEEIGLNTATAKSYHNVALYHDELRRREGRWLFSSRSYQYLWLDDRPVSGRTFPASRPGATAPATAATP